MKDILTLKNLILVVIMMTMSGIQLMASSHREAPLIANDPLADNVDLYAFRSPDNPDMITMIATYVPLQLPQGGPNYYSFGENIRYEIHVDNDASVVGDEIVYRFTFTITNEDPTTFFNIRLGKQNQKATYNLERSVDGGASFTTIIQDGVVPPNNIGPRSIESGVGLNTTYDALFNGAVTTASTGETVFAGPTDDPFFVDLGGIFDLGDAPRQDGGKPVDAVACYNVSALAIQVPISTLLKAGAPATPTNILDSDYVIGVWASASRPAVTTLSADGDPTVSGDWIQVSRLGMPLTNEAVIPIGAKDEWNSLTPYNENPAHFEYFYNPELALYMDDDQFGGAVPAFGPLRIQTNSLGMFDFSNEADGLFGLKGNPALAGTALDDAVFGTLLLPAAGKPRSVDLWPAFHTGVPNVIPYQLATGKDGNPLAAGKPFVNNFLPNGGDMLRLNMAVPVTPRDDANFSTLGLIQAAAIGLTVAPFNTTSDLEFIPNMDGFPNGRRLEDDVTRIELQAVSGVVLAAIGLWYDDYDPATSPSPVTEDLLGVLTYTTGVEANDKAFSGSFPYLAQPHDGTGACSGEIVLPMDNLISDPSTKVFVSSNNSGVVATYGFDDAGNMSASTFAAAGVDADGVHYDEQADVLYQLNRSDNVINAYSNVQSSLSSGGTPTLTATSTSDFSNGREIAVLGDKLVVAQDAADSNGQQNSFIIYTISPTAITLDRIVTTDINLWGMTFNGTTLMAIVDNSSDVGIFPDFLATANGSVTPARRVVVDGLVRTHGIAYDVANNVMVLTDVGSGAVADDGALFIINNWSGASADNRITAAEQIRIAGASTSLGNPVDVAYDHVAQRIYVAERANAGGRFLVFGVPTTGGDIAPLANDFFMGASAVSLTDCREPVVGGNDPVSIVNYSLDACRSFATTDQSDIDFSEFVPAYPNTLTCGSVTASIVTRLPAANNPHSCTEGVGGTPAMCVGSFDSCTYSAGNEKSIIFNVSVTPSGNDPANISQLTFFEKGPEMFSWISGPSGPNNYPTRYGVRVLRDGAEVLRMEDIATNRDWTLQTIDLSGDDFTVTTQTTFTFELLPYCLVGNGAVVNAWDIDEINVLGSCGANGNKVAIEGAVMTENGVIVENVEVVLQSNQPQFPITTTTDSNGQYAFSDLDTGFDYMISGEKNDDYLNGVSTLDIVMIQRHILGKEKLNSAYKLIAADVNQNESITAIDLIEIRKLILGVTEEFPMSLSWGFVDGEETVTQFDPYTAADFIILSDLNQNFSDKDMVAVKYGDVNNDVTANFGDKAIEVRSDKSLDFIIDNRKVERGQTYAIPFRSNNFDAVLGFQFSLELDGLTLSSVQANNIDLTEANMGHRSDQLHTVSWAPADVSTVSKDSDLFTINVTATADGNIADMIQLTSAYTSIEAYKDGNFEKVDIKLFSNEGTQIVQNQLYQNTPNPFSNMTEIKFNIAKAGLGTITIFDVTGKVVYSQSSQYGTGTQKVIINKSDIQSTSSILYYQLNINDFTATKKMTLIN